MSNILVTTNDLGITTVTLNRPDKHNAFDDEIIAQLTAAFSRIDTDSSIRAMILAAQGKSFSSGGDLTWMKRMANYSYDENSIDARNLAVMLRRLNELSKPTIARVHGAAYGGAVGLVSCCDIAIGTSHASFCLSEVKIGLIPATISPYVVDAIGMRAARRYFLTAERFDAQTAHRLGLLSELVDEDKLDSTIQTLTSNIINNGPSAVSASKQLIRDVMHRAVDDKIVEDTSKRIAAVRVSAEGQEGLSAFLGKRRPNWASTQKPRGAD